MKILPNTQRLGKLTFDSNQVRKSKTNPNVLVAKASDGKDYGVVRKSDGSYDFAGSDRNNSFGDRMATASANPNIGTRLLETAGLLASEPQRMMTRKLTNNRYNNPEEVVADSKLPDGMLKNTLGLAAGMVIDPFNLVGAGAGIASKASKYLPKLFKSSKTASNVLSSTKNLDDLKEATKFAKKYGYELPKNLDRIAQSDMLTDRTIRGLMNRHNTFVRGVSTNWDEIGRKKPEILKQLESKGFNLSTPEGTKAAAEYMATHIPGQTGYGRVGLNSDVFNKGFDGLYTSNSIPTAEGYTYGKGFIVKAKKPTDFSSTNRKDWITKNNPEYHKGVLEDKITFKLRDEDITSAISNEYNKDKLINLFKSAKNNPKELNNVKDKIIKELEDDLNYVDTYPNAHIYFDRESLVKNIEKIKNSDFRNIEVNKEDVITNNSLLKTEFTEPKYKTINFKDLDIINPNNVVEELSNNLFEKEKHLQKLNDFKYNMYQDRLKYDEKIDEKISKLQESNLVKNIVKRNKENKLTFLDKTVLPFLENKFSKLQNSKGIDNSNKIANFNKNYLDKNFPNWKNYESEKLINDKYAHYIHIGKPGEKVLEPIKSLEITPDKWMNKSRGHEGDYTKKLSAMSKGGKLNSNNQKQLLPLLK